MNDCHSNCDKALHKNVPVTLKSRTASFLGSIIILLLPKCPFCLVAYSSTITLCSTAGVFTHTKYHTDWGAYAAIFISVLIAVFMMVTYKLSRGYFRYVSMAAMAVCGSLCMYIGIFHAASMTCYYTGAALLVIATFIYSDVYHNFFRN
jgi:hypothetical protein